MANRGRKHERPNEPSEEARASAGGDDERSEAPGDAPREVEIAAVELVTSLARLDLEAALAYEAAAESCDDDELERHLRDFANDHRAHVEALNEALEAEGEPAVGPLQAPGTPVLSGLVRLTGPLGNEVIVVTLLGNEQLTNLSYDAALSYEWDSETEAMLRDFQADEERHMSWLVEKHDALGGHAEHPEPPPS
jgi:rubrerythrin